MTISSDTRSRILDVASRLFHEQGYSATGIATILREADVGSGSLYHFFSSKEQLLVGVLESYLERLQAVLIDPVEAQTEDPIERVFALMALYRGVLQATGCTMGCPNGNLALELSDNHPGVRELIHANFEGWTDKVEVWLVAAGKRLPRGLDRRALAGFVLTAMEGGMMQSRAAGSIEPFDESIAQLRQYFDLLLAK